MVDWKVSCILESRLWSFLPVYRNLISKCKVDYKFYFQSESELFLDKTIN